MFNKLLKDLNIPLPVNHSKIRSYELAWSYINGSFFRRSFTGSSWLATGILPASALYSYSLALSDWHFCLGWRSDYWNFLELTRNLCLFARWLVFCWFGYLTFLAGEGLGRSPVLVARTVCHQTSQSTSYSSFSSLLSRWIHLVCLPSFLAMRDGGCFIGSLLVCQTMAFLI